MVLTSRRFWLEWSHGCSAVDTAPTWSPCATRLSGPIFERSVTCPKNRPDISFSTTSKFPSHLTATSVSSGPRGLLHHSAARTHTLSWNSSNRTLLSSARETGARPRGEYMSENHSSRISVNRGVPSVHGKEVRRHEGRHRRNLYARQGELLALTPTSRWPTPELNGVFAPGARCEQPKMRSTAITQRQARALAWVTTDRETRLPSPPGRRPGQDQQSSHGPHAG